MSTGARRPEFSDTVVKTLFAYSNNRCGFIEIASRLGCEEPMTDPKWKQVNGEIAHIRGWAPGSARYDEHMTEDRNGFDNLLLLCPHHHKLVDRLEPDRYTVALMLEMKEKGSGGNRTGSDWTDPTSMATFVQDAIRQAADRIVGEEYTALLTPESPGAHVQLDAGASATGTATAPIVRTVADESRSDDEISRSGVPGGDSRGVPV
jgi:hypothetical protein